MLRCLQHPPAETFSASSCRYDIIQLLSLRPLLAPTTPPPPSLLLPSFSAVAEEATAEKEGRKAEAESAIPLSASGSTNNTLSPIAGETSLFMEEQKTRPDQATLRVASRPLHNKPSLPVASAKAAECSSEGNLPAPSEASAFSLQLHDATTDGSSVPPTFEEKPRETQSLVNPCPDLQALQYGCTGCCLSAARWLPLQQQQSPFRGSLVRSAWPAVVLQTEESLKKKAEADASEEKSMQTASFSRQQCENKASPAAGGESASLLQKQQQEEKQKQLKQQEEKQQEQQEEKQQEQQEEKQKQQEQQEEQKYQQRQEQKQKQKQQEQKQQQSSASDSSCAVPVIYYVRPLLTLEAHLFTSLLFALIADPASQQQQQQQAQKEGEKRQEGDEVETTVSPATPQLPAGVAFAALPRLWQEKYSALADLRHFQAAAGARDLFTFLEALPEVVLQRTQGALLVCVDGSQMHMGNIFFAIVWGSVSVPLVWMSDIL
ncbi:hypothetical protein cyc_08514 [Cyclospora cayetanensis]|uniref:Uncharacterized protein n=1 Tax=Cyclospora cayetanensis TaxID=88456 RepID=A0A1D3CZS2_9EIME|nr:hypothetical protein cyc_08514 [Cyclospora cayetanensis]